MKFLRVLVNFCRMEARKRNRLLKKMAEGYTVIEKKTVRQMRDASDGGEPSKVLIEEEYERYIPPNIHALELLYYGNPKRYTTKGK